MSPSSAASPTNGDDEAGVERLELPLPKAAFEHVINPLMRALLRSPLHWVASEALLLVTVTGRKTGLTYTTPVGYEEADGTLFVTSQTDRSWWRNLRGGAEVSVRLRGEQRRGHAEVVEDDGDVADYVLGFVDRHGPEALRRLALSVPDGDVPDREALAAGLGEIVVVEIRLGDGRG